MLTQEKLRIYLSIALLLAAVWLLHGFIPALLWAMIIVIATWPLRLLVARKARLGEVGTASAMTALVAAVFFLPVGYALFRAAAEAGAIVHWIAAAQKTGIEVPAWLHGIPLVGPFASEWWKSNLSDAAALAELIGHAENGTIVGYAQKFGLQIAHRLVTLVFTVAIVFFLYQHGEDLARKSLDLLRRSTGESGTRYGSQAAVAIRATVSGLVLVGLGEGLLIGLAYALAGAPHPALLGLLTGVLAMIPFAAPVIFGGVALVLMAQGSVAAGIGVFAFGSVVLFIGDHFVRPKIIGDAVKLPFLWVLLGILGGVEVYGLIGLFIGPALMALVMTLWRDLTES